MSGSIDGGRESESSDWNDGWSWFGSSMGMLRPLGGHTGTDERATKDLLH